MSLNQQHFTDAGLAMLGHANAGQLLNITKIVVGDGVANTPVDIHPLTALISHKADVAITRKLDMGNGTIIVSGVLTEANLTGAPFPLRELGIMAQIGTLGAQNIGAHIPSKPGGGQIAGATTDRPSPEPLVTTDQLYCASNVFADPADTVTPGGTSSHAFDITVTIDRATDVTVVIGDATVVDCENIPPDPLVGPGWYAQRVGNVFQFKRAVQGVGIELDEQPDRVVIAVKTLQVNVDVYVPANHPQCPDPSVGFPTVQAAHDYLLQFTIPTNRFATIHVYKGVFSTGQIINFIHPNSKQISIVGEPRVDVPVSVINYVDPTHKNIQVSSTTGLSVGQRCYLYNCLPGWTGGARITAIAGNIVTLSTIKRENTALRGNFNQSESGGTTRRLSYFPTVLVNTTTRAALDPVIACPNGIRQIENLCVEGGGYLVQLTEGTIKNCHVIGALTPIGPARRGINGYQGSVSLIGENVFTDCDFGVVALGVLAAFDQTVCNGCGVGLMPSGAGMAVGTITGNMPNTVVYLVHNQYGVLAAIGANYRGGTIFYAWNDIGFEAQAHAVITLGAAYGSLPQNNGTDLHAQGLSYIDYNRWGQPVPTCNPLAETVGNQQSLIHVTSS